MRLVQPRAGLHPSEEGNLNRQSLSYVRNLGRPLMASTNAQTAVSTFLSWAAKKLRAQSDQVYVLTVYVQQNRFDQRVLPFHPAGLGTLVHYLEAHYRPQPTTCLPSPVMHGRPNAALLAEEPTTKQTYAIRNSLIEQLVRLSYWRRQPRTWFINAGLAQLLSQYPEVHTPVPNDDE